MARKRYTTEQIIGLLWEAEVRLGQGQTIGLICRGIGISEQNSETNCSTARSSRRCGKPKSSSRALTR